MTQSKLVRAIKGAIFDVIVDLRKNSPTFGQWESFELSDTNFLSLFVPHGFAHGFCTLTARTEVMYKVDNFYSPEHDSGIRWDDPTLEFRGRIRIPFFPEKTKNFPFLINPIFVLYSKLQEKLLPKYFQPVRSLSIN